MKIPQINIQTTNAKLEMQNVIPAGKLEIHQERPEVILEISRPNITIDTTESRAALGTKNFSRFIKEGAQQGQQAVLEFIQKKVAEGNALANLEDRQALGAVLANLAMQELEDKPVELGITTLPKPEISVQRGEVKVTPRTPIEKAVQISYTPSKLEGRYIPYEVKIDIKV